MEVRSVITIFLQLLLVQDVFSRSIDQMMAQIEDDFNKQKGVEGRSSTSVWYDYSLVNRSEKLVKLQYDMIITQDTWHDVINTTEELPQHRRSKRNAVLGKEQLWSRRISFTISEGFSGEEKFRLLEAMNHWEEYTCLKFVEAKLTDRDVIVFAPKDGTCESVVGRMVGKQPINLSKGCMYKEILVHEIGHALGFYHEHMRADRDQYVTINYKNINESTMRQFDPLVAGDYDDFNKPYDYYSVMHYGKLFYSINSTAGLVTIEPKEKRFLDIIGTSPGLSYFDMKIANDLYSCSDDCVGVECQDGFIGGSNCECFCEYQGDPFDVRLCETQATCGVPNIDIEKYGVYDQSYNNVTFADVDTFPHRTQFSVMIRDENCEESETQYTCNDGKWDGKLPHCVKPIPRHLQKKCTVQYDIEKYVVTFNGIVQDNGDLVQSQDPINVTCKHQTPGIDDNQPVYCNNGQWDYDIEREIKCQIPKNCPMVNNATMLGSNEQGFDIRCLGGYSIAEDGIIPATFRCNVMKGEWEPFTPTCKLILPKFCPMITNATLTGSAEDGFDVRCIDGYSIAEDGIIPDKFWCNTMNGEWEPFAPACKPGPTCEVPNIDLAQYIVYDNRNKRVTFEDIDTLPHQTMFTVILLDVNCGGMKTNYTCNAGDWEGELPRCVPAPLQEKCTVQYDSQKYVVTSSGTVQANGDLVQSQKPIRVTCKYKTPGVDDDVPVFCNNGIWENDIEDLLKCQIKSFCPIVNNAIMSGSLEDGFEIGCFDGYSIAEDGFIPDRFVCTMLGVWEPFHPTCTPNNCAVPETNNIGDITNINNELLNVGAVVLHGSAVILTCPQSYVPDMTKYTCNFGNYSTIDGTIPKCVQVTCGQPSVSSTSWNPKKARYLYGNSVDVNRCPDRMKLIGDQRLFCTKHGSWSSKAECILYNCTVPETNNIGKITSVSNELLNVGAEVMHGSYVVLTCPRSYVPDETKYTCSYGKYNTSDGTIPICVQVLCGPPPVKGTRWKPVSEQYEYGDFVRTGRCRNGKELRGDNILHCTKHGNWSSTAECIPYCQNGIDIFEQNQNTRLINNAIWSTTSNVNSFQSCKRKCQGQKRYICRGFEFGHDGSGYKCKMYAGLGQLKETFLQEIPFWTTAIRKCKTA